jgi:ATP-binding cassette, subfamily B, multidrug efflux pump
MKKQQPAAINNSNAAKQPSSRKNKPAGSIAPILSRLGKYLRPHLQLIILTVLAAVLTSMLELAPPVLIRLAVDRFIIGDNPEYIWLAAGGLLVVALFQGGIDFARLYLTAYTGQKIIFKLRNSVFNHINQLSFSYFDEARTGDLMSRVTSDVEVLNQFFGRAAVIILTNIITLIGILIIIFRWSWQLALTYIALIPLIVLGMWAYARKVRPAWKQVQSQLAALTESIQETITGILLVKVLGREPFENERIKDKSKRVLNANIETSRIASFWMPYANVVIGIGTGLVLFIGGRSVIGNLLTLGTLIGFTTYMQMMLRPIRQTGMMLNIVMQSLAASERVFEILDLAPEDQDLPDAYPLDSVKGHIAFNEVSFAYQQGQKKTQALHNISFTAKPGEMVALVGPSGAGKSTLVHLLPRFYEPQAGQIQIDGHDIRQITLESLRKAIGIAFQDVFLFDASVWENIAYGNPQANKKEIEAAAKIVQIHEFIQSLPLGYNTPVGERGVRLSGGQKQRIALARVLLTDPRVLIFDEPTSSLDADTETKLKNALEKVRAGRTTFIIAHRLWTIREADQILVLDEGQIVERGRTTSTKTAHETLMSHNGLYADFYQQQFQTQHPLQQASLEGGQS